MAGIAKMKDMTDGIYSYTTYSSSREMYLQISVQQNTVFHLYSKTIRRVLKYRAKLIGTHQIENILPAVTVTTIIRHDTCRNCKARRLQITPLTHSMRPLQGINGSVFIDDTFNNNPDAARAAINFYLRQAKGRKILVFQPMIELGSFASEKCIRRLGNMQSLFVMKLS